MVNEKSNTAQMMRGLSLSLFLCKDHPTIIVVFGHFRENIIKQAVYDFKLAVHAHISPFVLDATILVFFLD
jgi:hypothetical protein